MLTVVKICAMDGRGLIHVAVDERDACRLRRFLDHATAAIYACRDRNVEVAADVEADDAPASDTSRVELPPCR